MVILTSAKNFFIFFFCLQAKQQMEERLAQFLDEHAPLSGSSVVESSSTSRPSSPLVGGLSINSSTYSQIHSSSLSVAGQSAVDPNIFRLISDGATRFIHHQIVEIASGEYLCRLC